MRIESLVARWEQAQRESADARLEYERTFAEALVTSAGKTAEVPGAEADLVALDAHRAARHAAVEAQALMHRLVFERTRVISVHGAHVSDRSTFEELLEHWTEVQHDSVDAWLQHESQYAVGLINATGRSAEVRKAQR